METAGAPCLPQAEVLMERVPASASCRRGAVGARPPGAPLLSVLFRFRASIWDPNLGPLLGF